MFKIRFFIKQDVFNVLFRNRTKALALGIIGELDGIKYSDALGVIRKQLICSVTSTAANLRAVRRARSERESFAKLCIVVEEADENLFWMGDLSSRKRWIPFTVKLRRT